MPNTITNRQMFFILFLVMTTTTDSQIPKVIAQYAGTGGWVTVLITTVLFGLAASLWVMLNNKHQGKTVFDYSKDLVGKAGAAFIAVYFIQYFLTFLVSLELSMSKLLQTNFLPNTPIWATSLAALPVIGYVAYKGVTNAARLIEIYAVIVLLVAVPSLILMILEGDANQILPLYNPAETGMVLSAVKETMFSFLGVEVLAIIPFTTKNGPKAIRTAILAVISVGLFYVLIVESSIMMVGIDEIVHYHFPLITAIRQVELPFLKVFQRIDLLYLTVGFIGLLAGLSIIYLNIVEYVCRMLPKISRAAVAAAVGFVVFLAEICVQGIKGIDQSLQEVLTYSGIVVAGLMPAVLLIITKVKIHANKKKV